MTHSDSLGASWAALTVASLATGLSGIAHSLGGGQAPSASMATIFAVVTAAFVRAGARAFLGGSVRLALTFTALQALGHLAWSGERLLTNPVSPVFGGDHSHSGVHAHGVSPAMLVAHLAGTVACIALFWVLNVFFAHLNARLSLLWARTQRPRGARIQRPSVQWAPPRLQLGWFARSLGRRGPPAYC